MKKLTPAVIDTALLAKLQGYPAARQRAMWENTSGRPRTFKRAITAEMAVIQARRCAYCGAKLPGEELTRDHIAPKEHHPEFTFFPVNLVLACTFCNTECKKAIDTILIKRTIYEDCTFSIIHPHIDDPNTHITMVGGTNQILIQVVNASVKGQETVRMFRLDSPERTERRAEDAAVAQDMRDIEHLPGNWRAAFEWLQNSKLDIKFRVV